MFDKTWKKFPLKHLLCHHDKSTCLVLTDPDFAFGVKNLSSPHNVLLWLLLQHWMWLRLLLDDPLVAGHDLLCMAYCTLLGNHLCHSPPLQSMLCRMCASDRHCIWRSASSFSLCRECCGWHSYVLIAILKTDKILGYQMHDQYVFTSAHALILEVSNWRNCLELTISAIMQSATQWELIVCWDKISGVPLCSLAVYLCQLSKCWCKHLIMSQMMSSLLYDHDLIWCHH